ncbi:MAG TPA: hypothetical protein VJU58_04080, partial [Microbacterium sp.]|nr:hypothetical protein [Microbacterium sp.]
MALGDPQVDPALAAQLYGTPQPSLADAAPWSWVPSSWNEFDEQGFQGAMAGQQIGPGPGAVGAPPELAAPPSPS